MPLAVVGDYEVSRKIGEGGYGRIFLGRRVTSSPDAPEVVLKQVKLPAKKSEREMCLREVSIMKGVHHPCILECVESFIHRDSVYIVMPHCSGGDLASLLARQRKRGRRLPESIVLDWFAQIVLGVEYLHSHNTLHRDLKSQNVFLRRDHLPGGGAPGRSRVALGDFGVARELQLDKVAARTFIGTPIFMSPEMFRHAPYGHKADMWALGCILYEMMALVEPFRAKSMEGLARRVQHGAPARLPDQYGKHIRDVAYDLLSKNPDERPSARELIRDRPPLRDACAAILRDAGATPERSAAAALGHLGRASVVNAFDAAQMAGRRRVDMRLPAAATKDEHAARSERTAAKQARRCGLSASTGRTRDDDDDGGTDPSNGADHSFAFARPPRVAGIAPALASRRAPLVPLQAPIREEPEAEDAREDGGGDDFVVRAPEPPPPRPGVPARVRGRPGAPGDDGPSNDDRDAGRFGRGFAYEARGARPPESLAPPPSAAPPRGWARRDRDGDRAMVPLYARHQPQFAADRWYAPRVAPARHLPNLPRRPRAGGDPSAAAEAAGGRFDANRGGVDRGGVDRVARLEEIRLFANQRRHRPPPPPPPRFHPHPRVDADDDAGRRAPRPRVASEREREVARLRAEVAALPSLRDARAMAMGGEGGRDAFGERVDGARVGGAAAEEAAAARAREAREREVRAARLRRDRAGGAHDPHPPRKQPPSGYRSAVDAYAPKLGGGARAGLGVGVGVGGARGLRHHELQARFRAAPAARRG